MNRTVSTALNGKNWWKPFLSYFSILLIFLIPLEFFVFSSRGKNPEISVINAFLVLLLTLPYPILGSIFFVFSAKHICKTLKIGSGRFTFFGTEKDYIRKNLKGLLFVFITFGLFLPWHIKNTVDYLARHTAFRSQKVVFLGSRSRIVKSFFLCILFVFCIFFVFLTVVFSFTLFFGKAHPSSFFITDAPLFLILALIITFFFSFMHSVNVWLFSFRWNSLIFSVQTKFVPFLLFVLYQSFLCVVSLGLYIPTFCMNYYRFFAVHMHIKTTHNKLFKIEFTGKNREGSLYLWGQIGLTLVTLGIYLPWAAANTIRYFITNTEIREVPSYI